MQGKTDVKIAKSCLKCDRVEIFGKDSKVKQVRKLSCQCNKLRRPIIVRGRESYIF
jgi:hypothetical protein